MAIRGRLFKYSFSFILAFLILFISIPSQAAEDFNTGVTVPPPVPDAFVYTGAATYKIPIEVPPGRHAGA